MKRIFKYLSKYKIESVLAPLFKMLEATFELLVPLVIKKLIDVGIVQGDRMYILSMCGLLVLFCAIGYISAVTAQYFSAKAAVGVAEDLRHDLYAKVQKFTYRDLDRIGVSNIITRLIGDVGQVQTGINMTLRLLLRSPFIVFGAMIMAFTIDVKCALVFAVAIPLLLAVVFTIMLVTIPLFVKVQENLERILRVIRQNLTGVRVIRAFGIEQKESAAFDRENDGEPVFLLGLAGQPHFGVAQPPDLSDHQYRDRGFDLHGRDPHGIRSAHAGCVDRPLRLYVADPHRTDQICKLCHSADQIRCKRHAH